MSVYVLYGTIGILILGLLTGLIAGLVRGLKRSSLHFVFFICSFLIAFFITKPVVSAVLGWQINVDGQDVTINQWIINLIQTNFDLSSFPTATEFIKQLPNAIASPILFLVLTIAVYFIADIIYLIVARISFGSKKKDFSKKKPYRAFGSLVGIVESFMFMFLMFAPLTSLTKTYQEIVSLPPATTSSNVVVVDKNGAVIENPTDPQTPPETPETPQENPQETTKPKQLQKVGEMLDGKLPPMVNEFIFAYNDSVIGKMTGMGGIDNKFFDYFSNFELSGEKIELRKELINIVDVYDEFTEVYNDITGKDFTNINFKNLKTKLNEFINNGLFKSVVIDTVKDFVINFDTIKTSMNITNLPKIVEDLISELKVKFNDKNTDYKTYIKEDVSSIIDIADKLISSSILKDITEMPNKSIEKILEVVNKNSVDIGDIAKESLNLNLITDCFETVINFVGDYIEQSVGNSSGLEIGLNGQIKDKTKMIDDIIATMDEFFNLNKKVDISAIIKSEDKFNAIMNIQNLDTVLIEIGKTFDKVRNLEVLVLPKTETRVEKVYVFDNILKTFNLDLLKDEVYLNIEDATKTKIDSYEKLFTFLKAPIKTAKELGLDKVGAPDVDFNVILDNILAKVAQDEKVFANVLIPFYQLSAMDLKTIVFNEVLTLLKNNTQGMLDFTDVEAEIELENADDVKIWYNEFVSITKVLNNLNTGKVGTENKTYLKSVLDGADVKDVMEAMINDVNFGNILGSIFDTKSFKGLTVKVFSSIDEVIGNITKVKPTTKFDKLKETKESVVSTIQNMLKLTSDTTIDEMEKVGKLLDILKTNAYNNGTKDGVFNEIFVNIIWYITGDNITSNEIYNGKTPIENAKDIKAYLGMSGDEYYNPERSYESIMKELKNTISFADDLYKKISSYNEISPSNYEQFIDAIKTSVDGIKPEETEHVTVDEKVAIINNLTKIINSTTSDRAPIISQENITNYGTQISSAIDTKFGAEDPKIGNAVKELLGLSK